MERTSTPLPKPSPRGCTQQPPHNGSTARRVEAAPGNPRLEREKLAIAASVEAYNRLRAGQRHVDIVALHPRSKPINFRLGRRLYRFADWATLATIVVGGITLAVGMAFWGIR